MQYYFQIYREPSFLNNPKTNNMFIEGLLTISQSEFTGSWVSLTLKKLLLMLSEL